MSQTHMSQMLMDQALTATTEPTMDTPKRRIAMMPRMLMTNIKNRSTRIKRQHSCIWLCQSSAAFVQGRAFSMATVSGILR